VGNSGGAFLFGGVTHRFGYAVTWSALTAILLVGALLSLGLRDEGGVKR
jgi:predicted MFS family arabinose efflux permease